MAKMIVKSKNPTYDIKLELEYHDAETMDMLRDTLKNDDLTFERSLLISACHKLVKEAAKSYGSFNEAINLMKEVDHNIPDEDKETEVTYDIDF